MRYRDAEIWRNTETVRDEAIQKESDTERDIQI